MTLHQSQETLKAETAAEDSLYAAEANLNKVVEEYAARLESADKEFEEFAYGAFHDLRAPLRVIFNTSKWLEEDLREHLTAETRDHLSLLRSRIGRMDRLLNDLLEYVRVGRSFDETYSQLVAGDELIRDVLKALPAEGFSIDVAPGFSAIQVPRMPLQQIFSKLIGNAVVHHHKKTGSIQVSVQEDSAQYTFAIKDDGPGIAPQYQQKVFTMFKTLRSQDQVEGSGMGLAVVRKIMDVFGGSIILQSSENQGSTFRFTWPKKQPVSVAKLASQSDH